MCWDALPAHLIVKVISSGHSQSPPPSAAAAVRLVCCSWRDAVDAYLLGLCPPKWPPSKASLSLLKRCSRLDLTRLRLTSSACTPSGSSADDHDAGGQCSISRCSSLGAQLDLMGAAVLQPRSQAYASPAAPSAAASLMCYVASAWPDAVPHVTPAACLRLWRCLPHLHLLQHLQLSGSMLLIKSVHTAVAGCPDAASGLRVLQQHAAEGADSFTSHIPVITHTYTLAVPPALCTMTGLQSLSVEWHLRDQQGNSVSGSGAGISVPVRRRSYEGGGNSSPIVHHYTEPTIKLPPQFGHLVNVQCLELVGHVTGPSTLLPLLGMQHLRQLVLGPGKVSVRALVPLAAAGVLAALQQLVLKQQGVWDVRSLVTVLAGTSKLQLLEVQELEMASPDMSAAGALQQTLTAADVSPLGQSLTQLRWSVCSQRLSAGASLLCPSASAAGLPGLLSADVSAAAAGPWLGGLSALQCLKLRGILRGGSVLGAPALDALSNSIGSCSRLQKLSVKGLGLPMLPDALAQLPDLRHVSIEACAVTRRAVLGPEAAVAVLGRCRKLQEVTLAGCELRHLPDWLAGLQDVTVLQLHGNYLQDLPAGKPCAGLPPALQRLSLADNRLRDLPDSIAQLSSLSQLVLDSNYLAALPSSIWDLPALRELSARENMLAQLPDCGCAHGQYTSRCSMECAGMDYGSSCAGTCPRHGEAAVHVAVAASAAAMPAEGLEGLSAEEVDLLGAIGVLHSSSTGSAVGDVRAQAGYVSAGAAVVSVPRAGAQQQRSCACARSLRSLVLADNQLTELPASMSQLTNLRELSLSKNQLRSLPDKAGIWALTGLTSLQLADNHLHRLPSGLAKLQHLVELDVSGNHLSVSITPEPAGSSTAATAATGASSNAAAAAGAGPGAGARKHGSVQSGVSPATAAQAPAASSSVTVGAPALPAVASRSTAAVTPRRARGAAAVDTPALVTVLVESPTAQSGASHGSRDHSFSIKQQPQALPCPLGRLPQLRQVWLGRQQVEGSDRWCGQCPLQLLLSGLFDLAGKIKCLAPPKHECPVTKAAKAAVAHITGATSASRARAMREAELLQAVQTEPGWVVMPAVATKHLSGPA